MVSNNRENNTWSNEINKNTNSLRDLDKVIKDNKNATVSLVDTFLSNANAVSKLTQIIKTGEKLQQQSLALGTSYTKFVRANTKAIDSSVATQQEMTQALLTGFSQGLRNNTDELNGLIDEMIITGQNTAALTMAMSNFSVVTGDNKDSQSRLSKTFEKVGKTYGISTERLAKSVDNLQQQMTAFSIYGPQASESLAEIKTGLMGMVGGKPAAERQIDVLLKMGDALNIAEQELFGLRDTFKGVRDGTINTADFARQIVESGERLERMMGESDVQRQGIAEAYGRPTVQSILQLKDLFKNNYELTDDMVQDQKDRDALIANRQRYLDRFFQRLAPDMHKQIALNLPAIAIGISALRFGMQTNKMIKADNKFGHVYSAEYFMGNSKNQALRKAALTAGGPGIFKGAGLIGKSARLLGLLGGPIGIGITALSFIPDIIGYFKENTEANKKAAKLAEEQAMRARNPAYSDSSVRVAATIASQYVRGRLDETTQDEMLEEIRRLRIASERFYNKGKDENPDK